jgi:hypothetical protein
MLQWRITHVQWLDFWTSSTIHYSEENISFRKLYLFLSSHGKVGKQLFTVVSVKEGANLNALFAGGRKQIQVSRRWALFGLLDDGQDPETQRFFFYGGQSL